MPHHDHLQKKPLPIRRFQQARARSLARWPPARALEVPQEILPVVPSVTSLHEQLKDFTNSIWRAMGLPLGPAQKTGEIEAVPWRHKKGQSASIPPALAPDPVRCGGSHGNWLDAPNASTSRDRGPGEGRFPSGSTAKDTSCEILFPDIEDMVEVTDPQKFIFQAAVDPRSVADMGSCGELRCNGTRTPGLCQ